jgi:hypothetical protein
MEGRWCRDNLLAMPPRGLEPVSKVEILRWDREWNRCPPGGISLMHTSISPLQQTGLLLLLRDG